MALPLWRDWLVRHSLAIHTQTHATIWVGVLETLARSAVLEGNDQLEWEQSYITARGLIKSLVYCLQNGYVNPGLWGIQAMPGICNCEKNGTARGSTAQ